MIEARGLAKAFGHNQAVKSVSFQIERGEVVGLLGPNGAGKTTTMRMLTTFLEPDAGDASIMGFSVREAPMEVRSRIGYLPESAPLYLEMSIEPYLDYVASVRGLVRAERRNRTAAMVEACGLREVLDREIGQLSRGYRQRVGLAATLLHEPEFLILDEPTSGLDPNQIVDIRALIRRVAEDRTVILSTHILPEVEVTCDRVVIIAQGEVKADSTAAELLSQSHPSIQREDSGSKYTVTLRKAPAQAQQQLEQLSFVQQVEALESDAERTRFRVLAIGDGGPERLFHAAVEHGWELVELHEERKSLESVFGDLTQGGDA